MRLKILIATGEHFPDCTFRSGPTVVNGCFLRAQKENSVCMSAAVKRRVQIQPVATYSKCHLKEGDRVGSRSLFLLSLQDDNISDKP